MSNRHRLVLAAILILAALFRLPLLSEVPPGFYVDEASTGYDAYSILLTGKDQYGEFMPVFARTFGAYNESLYRFLAVIPIWLFGLNEFAVRLPAAIAGILTVAALYSLAKELFDERIALLAALLLTISPWHVQFSRIGFRAILLPLFFCWGFYFFLKGVRKQPKYLLLSSLAFSLTLYTYASARVFVPLFLLLLVFSFRHELRRTPNYSILSASLFLAAFLFLTQYWLSPSGIAESVDSLDTDPLELLLAYLSYFNPVFLFFRGDPIARHSVVNFGQLHLFELATVPVGLFFTVREKQLRSRLLLAWLVLYPLPGALTDASHALRTIIGAPLFALISAYGLYRLASRFKGRRYTVFAALATIIILWRVALYREWYFEKYPVYSAKAWQYGMKEAITYSTNQPYDNIFISDSFFIPHMFVLFYTQYAPEDYQREALTSVGEGQFRYTDVSIGNYIITAAEKMRYSTFGHDLLMVFPEEAEELSNLSRCQEVRTIYRPNGTIASKLIECSPAESDH